MRLLNLKPFAGRAAQSAGQSSQSYRLTVIAPSSGLNKLMELLVTELAAVGLTPQDVQHHANDATHRIKMAATVACTAAQRAALVRFVHRAGMLPEVRGVRWESVPPADSMVLHSLRFKKAAMACSLSSCH